MPLRMRCQAKPRRRFGPKCLPSPPAEGRTRWRAMRWVCEIRPKKCTLIRNLHGQLLGVINPTLDRLLGGKHANELSLQIRLRHRLGKPGRITIPELSDGHDAGSLQQLGIFRSNALDAHAIDEIGNAEQLSLTDLRLLLKHLPTLEALGGLKEPFRRPNSSFLHFNRKARPKAVKFRQ